MINMMSERLRNIKAAGGKILVPYLTAGDPGLDVTGMLMESLALNGADVIELGVPFSDPLADGPVLQQAAQRALAAGVNIDDIFSLTARFSKRYVTPVTLLVYYNIIYQYGLESFCRNASAAGISALVAPDLPYEESADLDKAALSANLINIRFLSPTTRLERVRAISKSADGFIYCVTITGVTGKSAETYESVTQIIKEVRALTEVPLLLGFGIATPQHAAMAVRLADGVIVGTALVRRLSEITGVQEKCRMAGSFTLSLKRAMEQ